MGYRIVAIIGVFIASVVFAGSVEKNLDPHFKAVLDARSASVVPPDASSDPEKVNRLFETIDALAKRGKAADGLLVELLDYYLGEGPGEDVATFVIGRGKLMVPILEKKKRQPLSCLAVYKSICRDSVENRNAAIDSLIDEIKKKK
jgi:hypothetical protein